VPSGATVRAAGYVAVIRYLKKHGASGVHVLTAHEYADKVAHGVSVALIYEAPHPDRMLGGRNAGINDATWALAQARACGIANPRCIYFTCDFDVQPAQYATIDAYLAGAAAQIALGRVGLYGGVGIIKHAQAHHSAHWFWQTLAWSRGQQAPGIHLLQRTGTVTVGGVDCDVNEIRRTDFGQHPNPADELDLDNMNEAQLKALVKEAVQECFPAAGGCTDRVGNRTWEIARVSHSATQVYEYIAKRTTTWAGRNWLFDARHRLMSLQTQVGQLLARPGDQPPAPTGAGTAADQPSSTAADQP